MISMAVLVSRVRTCVWLSVGLYESNRAVSAAACGAAADVPKNGAKFSFGPVTAAERDVVTPSAAVISGFCTNRPPEAVRSDGVIAVPSVL